VFRVQGFYLGFRVLVLLFSVHTLMSRFSGLRFRGRGLKVKGWG